MQQSPSWEANKFSASQEIPRILWTPMVQYRVDKCLPPVPILSKYHKLQNWNPLHCAYTECLCVSHKYHNKEQLLTLNSTYVNQLVNLHFSERHELNVSIWLTWTSCWKAVPLFRRLVHYVLRQRFGFDPKSVHVEFVVDNMQSSFVYRGTLSLFPDSEVSCQALSSLHSTPSGCLLAEGRSSRVQLAWFNL